MDDLDDFDKFLAEPEQPEQPEPELRSLATGLAAGLAAGLAEILAELRAEAHETATLHQYLADMIVSSCPETRVVASIPVHSFPGGIVLAACERTYHHRAELRAAGGEWRVVATETGKILGWVFPAHAAQTIIELIQANEELAPVAPVI